jgi:small-conductance mechanosensitive channel
VSYDTDVERALALMEEAARAQPRVLKGPNEPIATLARFGESGIDLELGVWINDPENGQGNLKSALNLAILRLFRDNDIRIPFPRRDLNIIGRPDLPVSSGQPRNGSDCS